jgi:hypothetical protein
MVMMPPCGRPARRSLGRAPSRRPPSNGTTGRAAAARNAAPLPRRPPLSHFESRTRPDPTRRGILHLADWRGRPPLPQSERAAPDRRAASQPWCPTAYPGKGGAHPGSGKRSVQGGTTRSGQSKAGAGWLKTQGIEEARVTELPRSPKSARSLLVCSMCTLRRASASSRRATCAGRRRDRWRR